MSQAVPHVTDTTHSLLVRLTMQTIEPPTTCYLLQRQTAVQVGGAEGSLSAPSLLRPQETGGWSHIATPIANSA